MRTRTVQSHILEIPPEEAAELTVLLRSVRDNNVTDDNGNKIPYPPETRNLLGALINALDTIAG